MNKNNTRTSLKTSGLSLVICIAMLIGTTFAWFTDSITNNGNVIQSGTLNISGTVANVESEAATKPFKLEGINNGNAFGFGTPLDIETEDENGDSVNKIINESRWEPGKSNAKLLTVRNEGTLAAKIKLDFNVKDNGLENALWYDFIQVRDGQIIGDLTKKNMSTLESFTEKIELSLAANDSIQFILVYGMKESADNRYQNTSFTADVTVLAKQDTVEEDGFGNIDYDKSATDSIIVSTENELENAILNAKDGEILKLNKNIVLKESLSLNNKDITINLNNNKLENLNGKSFSTIEATGNSKVEIVGGTIEANGIKDAVILAEDDSIVKVRQCNIISSPSSNYAIITNGSKSKNTKIIIKDSSIISEKNYACYFPAGDITMENCNVKGAVIISGGNVKIKGGIYTADGFNGQEKIWHKEDTISYMAKFSSRDGCGHMGDSILIMDRRSNGYDLNGVTIKNVTFNTELAFANGNRATAYAIKYIDYNNKSDANMTNVEISNNKYNHKLSNGQNPLMFIGIDGSEIAVR